MRVYFSGIGGVGIGPLAEIAIDAGYQISGSDPHESLMTRELHERGVIVSNDQSGEFLKSQHNQQPIDWFVYTAALPLNHPELRAADALGIRISKRDEFLAHIIAEKQLKLIAVAGTHGKTSTTGMLVWTLKQLGVPISYLVGTTLSFGSSGKFDPSSDYFVYECDEFDRNFLSYSPYLSVITSIDYDHPDTYPTEDEYKSAFRQFGNQSAATILWQNDADYLHLNMNNAWVLQQDEVLPFQLAGAHNRRNGTLALKALERLGIGEKQTNQDFLEQFPGTRRRFEKLADNLYSDYGHHPVEIAASLQMARELSDHVVLVYQPHQNVRQHEIREQYTDDIFDDAEEVFWVDTYLSREDPSLPILTSEELAASVSNAAISHLDDSLWGKIQAHREAGHLVLCMGAGSIDDWTRTRIS